MIILRFKDECRIINPTSYKIDYEYEKDGTIRNFRLFVNDILVFESKRKYSMWGFVDERLHKYPHIFCNRTTFNQKVDFIRKSVIEDLDYYIYEYKFMYGKPDNGDIQFIDITDDILTIKSYWCNDGYIKNGNVMERIKIISSND